MDVRCACLLRKTKQGTPTVNFPLATAKDTYALRKTGLDVSSGFSPTFRTVLRLGLAYTAALSLRYYNTGLVRVYLETSKIIRGDRKRLQYSASYSFPRTDS